MGHVYQHRFEHGRIKTTIGIDIASDNNVLELYPDEVAKLEDGTHPRQSILVWLTEGTAEYLIALSHARGLREMNGGGCLVNEMRRRTDSMHACQDPADEGDL